MTTVHAMPLPLLPEVVRRVNDSGSASVNPEPASLTSMGVGAFCMVGIRPKRGGDRRREQVE